MAASAWRPRRPKTPQLDADFRDKTFSRIDQSIAMGALFTAHHLGAKAIVALTESGSTALWMSRHRVHMPIYALTLASWPPSARWRSTATCVRS